MVSDSLYYISKDHVKQLLTHVNMITQNVRDNVSTAFTKDQLTRANEVRRLHYTFLHPSANVLIKALKYGLLIGTRLSVQDVYLFRLVYGACSCCLAGNTISPSYKESLSTPAMIPGSIVYVDLIPFPKYVWEGIQYHMLVCDEFSLTCIQWQCKRKIIQI